jgi:hypothetical protein
MVNARTHVQPDAELVDFLTQLPALVDEPLQRRGAWFSERFHVVIDETPFEVTAEKGRIVSVERGPFLLRSRCFAIAASSDGWRRFWQPMPEPGWHDIFALVKRGHAQVDGNLHPLMANLQYVKDVLAAPRQLNVKPARRAAS